MSREIKFRAKYTGKTNWVYGGIWKNNRGQMLIVQPTGCGGEVNPYTVGEYIGVHDKNGREVYEGDVLKDNNGKVYKIVWGHDLLWLAITNEAHCNCYCPEGVSRRSEVIGNIYENPELLEG